MLPGSGMADCVRRLYEAYGDGAFTLTGAGIAPGAAQGMRNAKILQVVPVAGELPPKRAPQHKRVKQPTRWQLTPAAIDALGGGRR